MKVFASSVYYRRFVKPLCSTNSELFAGQAELTRYANGEWRAIIHEPVIEEDCLLIGSVAPPDEQLLALLTLADALQRQGATRISALLPYLGYARQDKFGPGESGGIAFIGSLLKTVGIAEVITFDVHSDLDKSLLGLPLYSLVSTDLFVSAIRKLQWADMTIVAPDEGARVRAQAMASALGNTQPVTYLVKQRTNGIVHLRVVGNVSPRVLIVDDIIDSGQTLVSACQALRQVGVKDIIIAVSHGLFTGQAWQQLFSLGVKTLLVSDSCPQAATQKHPNVQVMSLKPLLAAIRKEQYYEKPIV